MTRPEGEAAMIEVDLLKGSPGTRGARPRKAPAGQRLRNIPRDGWVVGSCLTMLLSFGFAGHLVLSVRGQAASLDLALEAALGDSVQSAARRHRAVALQTRRDSLAARVALIQEMDALRYLWPRIMDEVAIALPAEAWLTRLGQLPSGDERARFRVEGMARTNRSLTRFWNGLESSPFIRDVRLITSDHAMVRSGGDGIDNLYHFVLEAGQEDPPPEMLELVPLRPARAP